MVRTLIRLEGLAVFLGSLYFYGEIGASWLMFALLWIIPDLSMIGYLKDAKLGAVLYNIAHNYLIAFAVVFWGLLQKDHFILSLGIIYVSHIGLDRCLGFGLKYPESFKESHLQKL